MGNHNHGWPATPLRTESIRLRTMENGLDERLWWTRTGLSSLGCLCQWRDRIDWRSRLNPSRVNAATSTITVSDLSNWILKWYGRWCVKLNKKELNVSFNLKHAKIRLPLNRRPFLSCTSRCCYRFHCAWTLRTHSELLLQWLRSELAKA